MEIYAEYLQELLWLDDAIILEYNNIKELENRNIYVSFDNYVYSANYVLERTIYLVTKMQERKVYLEDLFKSLNTDLLYSLYEYISNMNIGRKIPLLSYILKLIDNKKEITR